MKLYPAPSGLSYLPYQNEAITQAEDRLHRIGQRDTVLVQHIVLDHGLDSEMVKKIIRQQRVVASVLKPRQKELIHAS